MASKLAREVSLSQARDFSDHSSICLLIYATQNGWKLPVMCEELGVKYDWALVDFAKNEQKSEAFLQINPNGRCVYALTCSHHPAASTFVCSRSKGAIAVCLGAMFELGFACRVKIEDDLLNICSPLLQHSSSDRP